MNIGKLIKRLQRIQHSENKDLEVLFEDQSGHRYKIKDVYIGFYYEKLKYIIDGRRLEK